VVRRSSFAGAEDSLIRDALRTRREAVEQKALVMVPVPVGPQCRLDDTGPFELLEPL
jgi:hypothetical protein